MVFLTTNAPRTGTARLVDLNCFGWQCFELSWAMAPLGGAQNSSFHLGLLLAPSPVAYVTVLGLAWWSCCLRATTQKPYFPILFTPYISDLSLIQLVDGCSLGVVVSAAGQPARELPLHICPAGT